MATAAAERRDAPVGELGADLVGLPGWSAFGGSVGAVGISIDREPVAELRWPQSVRTFHTMRNDTQLSGLYRGTTLPVRRYVWGINPNGAPQSVVDRICSHYGVQPIDVAWQEFLTGQSAPTKRRQNRFSFDNHMRDAQRALYNGHEFFEIHGHIGDDGLWHPDDISFRSPFTIAQIQAAPNGDLIGIRQAIGIDTPILEASRLVAYVFDQEPGDWYGRSMYRSCYREWLLKDRLLRVDAINHEKSGGILLNEAPQGATPAQIEALSMLAQSARVGGGGAVPAGTNPIFIRGTGSDVIGSINRHDEAMAREFLMMFMALGTSSSGGNRALAGSFLDWFALAQEAVAIFQRDTFQRDVIERDVEWNDGPIDYVPQLVFKRPEDANPLDQLAVLATTADAAGTPGAIAEIGVDGNTVPVAAVRFNGRGWQLLPQVVVDGDTHEQIRVEHAAFERDAGRTPAARRRGGSSPSVAAAAALPTVGHRDPYTHEEQAGVDFAQIDTQWTAQATSLLDAWQTIRAGQIDELVQQIEDAAGDLTALAGVSATPAGASTIETHLHTMAALGAGQAVAEAKKQGLAAATAPDLAAVNDEMTTRAAALEQLLTSSIGQAAATKAVQISSGTTDAAQLAAGVRDYLEGLSDTWLHDQLGGALSAAQNSGRLTAMEHNGASRYYASELLDENTCEPCSLEDGTEFATAEDAAAAYPAGGYYDCDGGPRCRGTVVAVYDEATSTEEDE